MELIQKSNFRVQGMFFNNCIEKNQNKTHFKEGSSSHTSLRQVRVTKRMNFRKSSEGGDSEVLLQSVSCFYFAQDNC